MSRKFSLCSLVVFICVLFCVNTYAKGPFITPGARALGYGSAFVAISDDLTAIYYNPAGLAYQKDTQVMVTSFFINYPATADHKTVVGSDKYSTSAVIPFGAFSMPIYKDIVMALGVYCIGGGGGKVEDLSEGTKIAGQQSFMVYNISLAKQLNDKFSIGLGFDAIEMSDKMVLSAGNVDYNRSAFGFQGNLGLMYKPIEKLSTGFILRTGTYIGLPEETNPVALAIGTKNQYTYPLTTEIGLAYDLFAPLTLSASVAYNTYSWNSVDCRNTFQFKVGSEYRATEKLALHLGFFTDPSIYNKCNGSGFNKYGLTNVNMYNMQYLSASAEYAFTQSLKFALSLTHSFTPDVCYEAVTYEYDVNVARFDISYKFL